MPPFITTVLSRRDWFTPRRKAATSNAVSEVMVMGFAAPSLTQISSAVPGSWSPLYQLDPAIGSEDAVPIHQNWAA